MSKQEEILMAILNELRRLNQRVEQIQETALPSIFNVLFEIKENQK